PPRGQEEVKLTKHRLGWPGLERFYVPDEALAHWRLARERGARLEAEWSKQYEAYRQAFPELAAELERRLAGRLADGWDDGLPTFAPPPAPPAPPADAPAPRAASGKVLNALAPRPPGLVGGSADLATPTQPAFKNGGRVAGGSLGRR